VSGGILPLLALTFAVLAATSVAAAPAGPPVRIGSTLALTGPLAATSMIHKIAGEISIEQINKRNGFVGRPIEWVLRDDQSRPEVTRTLYERLITVDKVDLIIGPYGTGAILSAMAVAQRYQKLLIHHTFGIPKLAKYPMQFPSSGLAFESEKVVPTRLLDALESTGRAPTTIAIVTSKYPSLYFISAGAREVAAARGLKVALYLEYESANRDFVPIAARVKEADADFLWVGALALEANLLLDAFQMIGYRPRGQYHLFPPPGPLLTAPGAANTLAFSTFEAHPPMTNAPAADALCKLFAERAKQAGLPYPLVETTAAASLTAWLLLETAVNTARTLEDKALAAWLKANRVDTPFGRLSFEGENNYGAEHVKVKQNHNGRWLIVWPREFAAPGASVVYPAP
jgi:branched-chain amino acid transport system substrate-binding protein